MPQSFSPVFLIPRAQAVKFPATMVSIMKQCPAKAPLCCGREGGGGVFTFTSAFKRRLGMLHFKLFILKQNIA